MLRLIKSDLYKACHMKSFWVLSILGALMAAGMSWLTVVSINEFGMDTEFSSFIMLSISAVNTTMYIFAVLFSLSDFGDNTIKNVASKGFKREFMYISKVVASTAALLVNKIAAALITVVIVFARGLNKMEGFFIDPGKEFWQTLGSFDLLLPITYIAIAVLVATLLRSTGPAISIFLVYILGEMIVLGYVQQFIDVVLHLKNINLIKYSLAGCTTYPNPHYVILVYLAVALAGGIAFFKKRDI